MKKMFSTVSVLLFATASLCLAESVRVGAAADTHIIKSFPAVNYGGLPYMSASTAKGATDIRRGLIYFDLSKYAGMKVTINATLTLSAWGISGQTKGDKIEAYLLDSQNAGWDEKTATWKTKDGENGWFGSMEEPGNGYSSTCIVSAIIPSGSGGFRPLTIPAEVIQSWIDNPVSNAGLLIRLENETSEDDAVHWNTKETTKGDRFVPELKFMIESGGGNGG